MLKSHTGELSALLVAIFWSVTALSFEAASKRVGSLPVNIIRLVIGLVFLSFLNLMIRGMFLPADATMHNWIWLSVSGLIGFVLGDFFLFKSYTIIGSWFAMLIMTLAPPMAAIFGWIILDEQLNLLSVSGIIITMAGIAIAMFSHDKEKSRITVSKPFAGLLYAFGGALGQALGIVFSKYGMQQYSPFAATQIRIITGILGFTALITILGKWQSVRLALSDRNALRSITLGSFFGPFLGVSFSLIAIRHTSTGVASTIMALVPVFIIPPSIWLFRHRITTREVVGTIISLGGVALFFL